jgi:serine/threonine protein kinase
MTNEEALQLVERASKPEDLFPEQDKAKRRYKQITRFVHPDVNNGSERAKAAFQKVTNLWNKFNGVTEPEKAITITTKHHEYSLSTLLYKGDIANIYKATSDVGNVLVKIPRSPKNNDLMQREYDALKKFKEGDDQWKMFVTQGIESFKHRADGLDRVVNVTQHVQGLRSLQEVGTVYPNGLDPRDMAWMFRRLLIALGFAHDNGVIHGAVNPEHVLILPEAHGLVLVDWCYSSTESKTIPAIVPKWKGFYPTEVTDKEVPTVGTDLYMTAKTMQFIVKDKAPTQIRAFFNSALQPAQKSRPDNAWNWLAAYDELIERLYGPRKFREFYMPKQKEN